MDPDSDPDADPAIFVFDLPKMPTKTNFFKSFFAYYFMKVHVHHFHSKIKSQKKPQSSRNQGFSYFFCLAIEGSGSIPLIRIRIQKAKKHVDPVDPYLQHCPEDWTGTLLTSTISISLSPVDFS
jgi:hypothetical protein